MGSVVIDMSRSLDGYIAAWGGKGPLGDVPCFVVTHTPPASSDPVFAFVTGGGRRLFDQLPERGELDQTGLSQTDGVTHLEYRVVW
jgi:hypothetical protein